MQASTEKRESQVDCTQVAHASRGRCQCADCKVMPHMSDCAVHNKGVPELLGPCDCGAWLRQARELLRALLAVDRASERSVAKGGPELDEPVAVAYDALDEHLKLTSGFRPSPSKDDVSKQRQNMRTDADREWDAMMTRAAEIRAKIESNDAENAALLAEYRGIFKAGVVDSDDLAWATAKPVAPQDDVSQ